MYHVGNASGSTIQTQIKHPGGASCGTPGGGQDEGPGQVPCVVANHR